MATIVNKKRPSPSTEEDELLNIMGYDNGPTIYDDTYGDHDMNVITSRFHSDSGGMTKSMEEDLSVLQEAARTTFAKRKPIIDWKTKNASFIELHNDLRRLGIKNNTFFLKLYDRDLQNIDPFSPALPLEMQIKVYLECVVNPWYYLREIARVPSPGKPIEPGGGDQYQIDRTNLATWYLFLHHIDTYASKPRQCGKTQDALHKVNYAYHFGSTSSSALLFNKDLALSKENLARMKDQRDLYPEYLQMRVAFDDEGNTIKGMDNITSMKNPVTGCSVKVMPCATSKEAATRLGRGYTAPIILYDEFDFSPYIIDALYASAFAYSTASTNAIKSGSCSSRLLLSTPGDLSTRDGKAATDYIRGTKETRGMFVWNDKYYDIPIGELRKEVQSTRYNGVVFVEHSWQQLKKSMKWFEKQCNLVAYNQEIILREIQLQRLAGSNQSPFTREQQLYLSSHKRKPVEEVDVKAKDVISTVYLYEKFDRRIPYIFGIDPSEGLSEDNNAMIVINPLTYKIAAEFKCPYISPKDFGAFIVSFMDRFCPNALLVVENNRGRSLLQYLTDSHYRHRIWYDKDRLDKMLVEQTDRYGGTPTSTLHRKVQGFVTSTRSRNLLFTCLEEMVMENIDCIYSENLVNELLTLIRKPTTGKIEAAPGEHDDCVMAYLIGLYVYLNATNLSEFGISRHMRAPGQEVEPEVENAKDYKRRVQSSLGSIPDKYRGIFEDFVAERDGSRDAEDYAKELARAQAAERAFHIDSDASTYDDNGDMTIPFDKSMKGPRDGGKLGMKYHAIGEQYKTFNTQAKDSFVIPEYDPAFDDGGDEERMARQILESNFDDRDRYNFDPDEFI